MKSNMVDLRRLKPPKEKKKDTSTSVEPVYEERPYCLRFTLEAAELDKLGLEPMSFSDMKEITATFVIDPISIRNIENKSEDKYDINRNKSVEFQIMQIGFDNNAIKKDSIDAAIANADKTRKKV